MTTQELIVYLAFEQGKLYERIWQSLDLDNIVNFNDILYASSKGAQWKMNGNLSDIGVLFSTKITSDKNIEKIKKLNEITENIRKLQVISF